MLSIVLSNEDEYHAAKTEENAACDPTGPLRGQ